MDTEILQDMKAYFGEDYNSIDENTLLFCIKRAMKSFQNQRKYPDTYSEQMRLKDMENYYACIFDLALYWTNMQGVEFQLSHSENGVNRSWETETEIYSRHHIVPIARIV